MIYHKRSSFEEVFVAWYWWATIAAGYLLMGFLVGWAYYCSLFSNNNEILTHLIFWLWPVAFVYALVMYGLWIITELPFFSADFEKWRQDRKKNQKQKANPT